MLPRPSFLESEHDKLQFGVYFESSSNCKIWPLVCQKCVGGSNFWAQIRTSWPQLCSMTLQSLAGSVLCKIKQTWPNPFHRRTSWRIFSLGDYAKCPNACPLLIQSNAQNSPTVKSRQVSGNTFETRKSPTIRPSLNGPEVAKWKISPTVWPPRSGPKVAKWKISPIVRPPLCGPKVAKWKISPTVWPPLIGKGICAKE